MLRLMADLFRHAAGTVEVFHTAPKPFVLLVMPFDEAFQDVHELGIRPAC